MLTTEDLLTQDTMPTWSDISLKLYKFRQFTHLTNYIKNVKLYS